MVPRWVVWRAHLAAQMCDVKRLELGRAPQAGDEGAGQGIHGRQLRGTNGRGRRHPAVNPHPYQRSANTLLGLAACAAAGHSHTLLEVRTNVSTDGSTQCPRPARCLVGAWLAHGFAWIAPPSVGSVERGCVCEETGSGVYKCHDAQTRMLGAFSCEVDCAW